jgi:DNA modification methylase
VNLSQEIVSLSSTTWLSDTSFVPHFVCGDSGEALTNWPGECVDFCMTSPPYWGHRQYSSGGIGLEESYEQYIDRLLAVTSQIHRVLKATGSFWLNIGDTYCNKSLVGVPWRVALALTDRQGWVLRNSVIWNKVKGGPDTAKDRLRSVHENVFHFTKIPSGYFYDADAVRSAPKKAKVVNGSVVSATGVSGIRYKRQIELSGRLTDPEKVAAFEALGQMLQEVREGKIGDFRMIIRGQQRTTHSDSEQVSGRARELQQKGFYFLRYHPNGSKPSDVWDILPEDTQKREGHFAPYPEDLCKIPIASTCPLGGWVLDPFCGTGTTMLAAHHLRRRSVGVDLSSEYLAAARQRCGFLL